MKLLAQLFPDSYYIKPQLLSVVRIVYCVLIITFIGLPSYTWIAQAQSYVFVPPVSFARLFSGIPGLLFFQMITLASLLFFVLMLLGLWCRWTSLLFSLSSIVGSSFWYSFGKIDHHLLLLVTPIFLGFAGWGTYFSIDHLIRLRSKSLNDISPAYNSMWITLMALSIGFSMFTAGAQKLQGGWQNWQAEAVHYHLISRFYGHGKAVPLTAYLLSINNHVFWKFMDYSALVLEIGFLVSVVRRKLFLFFIAFGVFFHILVLLTFKIPFYSNLIAYSVFLPWQRIDQQLGITKLINDPVRYPKAIQTLAIFTGTVFFYWLIYFLTHKYSLWLLGLIETVISGIGVDDAHELATYCLFVVAALALLYVVMLYFTRQKEMPLDTSVN